MTTQPLNSLASLPIHIGVYTWLSRHCQPLSVALLMRHSLKDYLSLCTLLSSMNPLLRAGIPPASKEWIAKEGGEGFSVRAMCANEILFGCVPPTPPQTQNRDYPVVRTLRFRRQNKHGVTALISN